MKLPHILLAAIAGAAMICPSQAQSAKPHPVCPQGEREYKDVQGVSWCMDSQGRSYAAEHPTLAQVNASRGQIDRAGTDSQGGLFPTGPVSIKEAQRMHAIYGTAPGSNPLPPGQCNLQGKLTISAQDAFEMARKFYGTPNVNEFFCWIYQSAVNGDDDGIMWYAILKLRGSGTTRDINESSDALLIAAELGNPFAEYYVSKSFATGYGNIAADPNQADYWKNKAMATPIGRQLFTDESKPTLPDRQPTLGPHPTGVEGLMFLLSLFDGDGGDAVDYSSGGCHTIDGKRILCSPGVLTNVR